MNESSANQTERSAGQDETPNNAEQTDEETNADGENQTPEMQAKPKRYVSLKHLFLINNNFFFEFLAK